MPILSHWYHSTRKNPVASGIRTPDLPLSRRTPEPLGQRGGFTVYWHRANHPNDSNLVPAAQPSILFIHTEFKCRTKARCKKAGRGWSGRWGRGLREVSCRLFRSTECVWINSLICFSSVVILNAFLCVLHCWPFLVFPCFIKQNNENKTKPSKTTTKQTKKNKNKNKQTTVSGSGLRKSVSSNRRIKKTNKTKQS